MPNRSPGSASGASEYQMAESVSSAAANTSRCVENGSRGVARTPGFSPAVLNLWLM